MKRQITLDTETTGLRPEDGHRILEIGAVEMIDGVKTGKIFHHIIDPERDIPYEVVKIHGIDNAKVVGKPKFRDIMDEFLEFIKDSEVVIHNAKFDIGFLNNELDKMNKGKIWNHLKKITCSLELDKRLFSEERKHNLDAICNRLEIDNSARTFHGALLDSDLLADVFIEINKRFPTADIEADLEQTNWVRGPIKRYADTFEKISLTENEINNNNKYLEELAAKEKVTPVFSKSSNFKPT